MTKYAEVLDSIKSLKEFLDLNKIKEHELDQIIVVWDEHEEKHY